MQDTTNPEKPELIDADFDDVMDNESFKMISPIIDLKPLDNLYDFDEVAKLAPDTKTDLKKSDELLEEEEIQAKLRADFLKEIHKKRFSGYEKIKNNYYLEGELVIKVKKGLLRNVKEVDGGENPSPNAICAILSEYKPIIKDIPKDNPNFMDNFKNGLIMAIDEDGFDIDTIKVTLTCPKRKEMLKIINEVKNRNSLKFGNEHVPDDEIADEPKNPENKFSQQNAVSEMGKVASLALLNDPEALLALPSLNNPEELIGLPSPKNQFALPSPNKSKQDIDEIFNVDDFDLDFDNDDNQDFTNSIEEDYDLEIGELDKKHENVLDGLEGQDEELDNIKSLLENDNNSNVNKVNNKQRNKSRTSLRR